MQHDIQIANTASNLMLCNKWYCGLRSNHIESCIGTSIWPTKQNDCIQNLKHNNITDEEGDENQIYFNICIFYIFSSPRRSYVINVLSFKHYHYSSFSHFTRVSSTHDEVNIGIKTNISLRVCALFLKDVLVISWKLNLYHLTNT